MKLILLSFAIFCCTTSSLGQLTKKNWIIGGSAGLTHTNNNSTSSTLYKNTTFSISPNIGYFIFDKFVAGAKLSILLLKYDYSQGSGGGTISYSTKSQFYNLGPFVRYYFLEPERRINLFLEGTYQYQLRKDISPNSNSKQTANNFSVNGGPVIFFNSNVGIEFTIGYSSLKYNGFTGSNNTIQTNIGLQIHLQKDE